MKSNEIVDFSGAAENLWAKIAPGLSPEVTKLMTTIGLVLILFAAVKWVLARHRGTAVGNDPLLYSLILGCLLAAPGAILPLIARIADAIANPILNAVI